VKTPLLLALVALSTAQAAEPTGTLTLACEGTTKLGEKTDPISMGIIVDFADRTVHGFGYPGFSGRFDFPVNVDIPDIDTEFQCACCNTNGLGTLLNREKDAAQGSVALDRPWPCSLRAGAGLDRRVCREGGVDRT